MPVQEEVIPYLLGENNDVVALAQTGTGKTAAFGLPLHKFQVAVAAFFGIVQCLPHGKNAGILQSVCFTHATGEP